MITSEQKIKKQCGIESNIFGNMFLHIDGTTSPSQGHNGDAKASGTTLIKYLDAGGCRIKRNGEFLAIECNRMLTTQQINTIKLLLCSFEVFYLVVQIRGKVYRKQAYRRITAGQFERMIK